MNQYEAMLLFDPTFGTNDQAVDAEIQRVMDRAGAETIMSGKWAERRLAFRVKGRKRGIYVLHYFKAPPEKIAGLERDVQLSENILRALIVRADYATPAMMKKALEGPAKESPREEGGRGGGGRRSGGRDGRWGGGGGGGGGGRFSGGRPGGGRRPEASGHGDAGRPSPQPKPDAPGQTGSPGPREQEPTSA